MTAHEQPRAGIPEVAGAQDWRRSSLWARSLGTASYEAVSSDRRVEVVVIGAGIAGLLTATLLDRAGADVLVLDRHDVGGVATRNTTAKVSALQGTTYRSIRDARDEDTAAMYAAAQLDAIGGYRQLIGELGIDCGLTEAPAYTFATEGDAAERASDELAAASAAGLPVSWVADTELPFPVAGAVKLDGQLHLDPGRLCAGLAAALGAERVAEHSAVLDVDESKDGCAVAIDGGVTVTADHVVIATQAPILDPALLANRCTPMQSYCLAARLPGPVPAGMYLSCDASTRSLRPATVDDDVVAVIGGAGHHMGDEDANARRWETLRRWAEDGFGPVDVTHRWATHDLVPTDHVPFIGRLTPTAARRWVASGFAKWGMTNAYVAAHLITTAIGGGAVPWASAFDATRISATVNRQLLSLGKTAATHLVTDRLTRHREPRCTHQGCVLRADSAMGTWDCPCHGSRFAADGSVIQGPATAPLKLD
jgi:glycine/D-amino acid oxidase-like deaminating enzyme